MSEEERPSSSGEEDDFASQILDKAKAAKSSKSDSRKVEKLKKKIENRGIVYLSRLPPHLVRFNCKIFENVCPPLPLTALLTPQPCRNLKSFDTC